MTEMPVIYREKCNGCGLCVSVCSVNALVLIGQIVATVETENCGWCIQCEVICPTGAIVCPYEIVAEER